MRLQLGQGEYYNNLAEGNRIRTEEISARRGLIFDRNKTALVKNKPNFNLVLNPPDLPSNKNDREILKKQLIDFFPQESLFLNQTWQNLNSQTPTQVLIKNIPFAQAILIEIKVINWPGLSLEQSASRYYQEGELMAHLLGYTGPVASADLENQSSYNITDIIGKSGLELFYENSLRGRPGNKKIEVNARGKEQKIIEIKKPQKGNDLILTVDLEAQKKLAEIISNYQKKFQIKRAAAVVLNPQNGEIIALISQPSYNNNDFSLGIKTEDFKKIINDPDKPLFNRATQGEYPPGSTFKLIVGAAALEEGLINQNWTMNSVGGLRVGDWFFPDWSPGGHGAVNIRQAIAWSVNSFFYTIGGGYEDFTGLGVEKIILYAQKFNLDRGLNIDLPDESSGFLPNKIWKQEKKNEPWYLGDTYHLSIGQGDIKVTPLEIAGWTMVFANGGKLFTPQVLKSQVNSAGVAENISPKIIRENFLQPQTVEIIKQGLRDGVVYGSSGRFKNLPIAVAGKTGTAQNSSGEPHGWWTGFAPYDKPEIVITILMENAGGSEKAIPAAYDFLEWYFNS